MWDMLTFWGRYLPQRIWVLYMKGGVKKSLFKLLKYWELKHCNMLNSIYLKKIRTVRRTYFVCSKLVEDLIIS